ncbi:hypothetical protein ERJ75_001515100 [Trypanosoma vivax]|nr:hypothetical protein TRVL_05576 [Trypanosoma vivax]KAH8606426.1 hypothetical protein ERJ75_001515100 [Trypanosoma vivax]
MALSAGPAAVVVALLRRVWDLTLHIVRLRVPGNFRFVFSQYGVPRKRTANTANEQCTEKPQSHPKWITDSFADVEGKVRNEMHRAFEENRMTRTHRSVPLDCVRTAPRHSRVDRLGGSLLEQFGTRTSTLFGWLQRVLSRRADRLE